MKYFKFVATIYFLFFSLFNYGQLTSKKKTIIPGQAFARVFAANNGHFVVIGAEVNLKSLDKENWKITELNENLEVIKSGIVISGKKRFVTAIVDSLYSKEIILLFDEATYFNESSTYNVVHFGMNLEKTKEYSVKKIDSEEKIRKVFLSPNRVSICGSIGGIPFNSYSPFIYSFSTSDGSVSHVIQNPKTCHFLDFESDPNGVFFTMVKEYSDKGKSTVKIQTITPNAKALETLVQLDLTNDFEIQNAKIKRIQPNKLLVVASVIEFDSNHRCNTQLYIGILEPGKAFKLNATKTDGLLGKTTFNVMFKKPETNPQDNIVSLTEWRNDSARVVFSLHDLIIKNNEIIVPADIVMNRTGTTVSVSGNGSGNTSITQGIKMDNFMSQESTILHFDLEGNYKTCTVFPHYFKYEDYVISEKYFYTNYLGNNTLAYSIGSSFYQDAILDYRMYKSLKIAIPDNFKIYVMGGAENSIDKKDVIGSTLSEEVGYSDNPILCPIPDGFIVCYSSKQNDKKKLLKNDLVILKLVSK